MHYRESVLDRYESLAWANATRLSRVRGNLKWMVAG
jgi:hypothetical protein